MWGIPGGGRCGRAKGRGQGGGRPGQQQEVAGMANLHGAFFGGLRQSLMTTMKSVMIASFTTSLPMPSRQSGSHTMGCPIKAWLLTVSQKLSMPTWKSSKATAQGVVTNELWKRFTPHRVLEKILAAPQSLGKGSDYMIGLRACEALGKAISQWKEPTVLWCTNLWKRDWLIKCMTGQDLKWKKNCTETKIICMHFICSQHCCFWIGSSLSSEDLFQDPLLYRFCSNHHTVWWKLYIPACKKRSGKIINKIK